MKRSLRMWLAGMALLILMPGARAGISSPYDGFGEAITAATDSIPAASFTYKGPLDTVLSLALPQTIGLGLADGDGSAPGATPHVILESVPASSGPSDPVPPAPPSAPEPASIVIFAFGLAIVITARGYYL